MSSQFFFGAREHFLVLYRLFKNRESRLSRRLARYYLVIALFQSPLSERSVTVSVSLRSPVVTPVASRRQVTLSATEALRISRTVWLLIA